MKLGEASQGRPPLLWVFGDKMGSECCTQLCGPLLDDFCGQMIRRGPGIKGLWHFNWHNHCVGGCK